MKQARSNRGRNKDSAHPGDVIVKLFTLPTNIVSNAGGVVAVTTTITSASVQSFPATEWASFAARYQQYRVKETRVFFEPCFPAAMSEATTGLKNLPHSSMFVADYIGSSAPTTYQQVLSDERSIVVSTAKPIRFKSDWNRNPNAKLWNPTSAAVPTANLYGLALASNAGVALPASQTIYAGYVEWVVEFRGSQ